MHDVVRPEYYDHFHDLALSLCRQPDLNAAFLKPTLQEPFNIKLAYNLFGIMNDNGIFTTRAVAPIRKCLTEKRADEYFKDYLYKAYGSYTSELSDTLLAVARNTITAWKQ